jgi:hypothetical protein
MALPPSTASPTSQIVGQPWGPEPAMRSPMPSPAPPGWRADTQIRKESSRLSTSTPRPVVEQQASPGAPLEGLEAAPPADGFRVPVAASDSPLPVYAVLPESNADLAHLTETEQKALRRAEELFYAGLEAAPTHDEASPEYADYWSASRTRSDNYLRIALGWRRFTTLSPKLIEAYHAGVEGQSVAPAP